MELVNVYNLLRNAINYGDSQELINMYAKQIADELCKDNKNKYEETLKSLGYKEISKVKKISLKDN